MSALSAWVAAIFVAVVVTIGAELLFSDTRMSKFIRSVTATVTLLIIVMPLPLLIKSGFSGTRDNVLEYNPPLDESYIDFVAGKRLAAVESALETELEKAGIDGAKAEISGKTVNGETEIVQVKINLTDSVIDEKLGHINMNELAVTTTCNYLGVEKSKVIAYGQKDR